MERAAAGREVDQTSPPLVETSAFEAAMRSASQPMLITDPHRGDNPIVFANEAFLGLTGYTHAEVAGRNCRFLQGIGTEAAAARRIALAVAAGETVALDILNYRKDGTPFWNALSISPVFGANGALRYFFAASSDVTERRNALQFASALVREIDHRVKNSLQMVSALITLQIGAIADPATRGTLATMLHRIEALSTLHRRFHLSDDPTRVSLSDLVRDIVADLIGASGRTDIVLDLDLEPVRIRAQTAAAVALVVNELVTNALKHAFADRPGRVTVRLATTAARHRIEIADDGPGMPDTLPGAESFGSTIVQMLAQQLRATLTVSACAPTGMRVVFDLPAAPASA